MWLQFPSDEFITRYYGPNQTLPVRGMPSVTVEAHDWIRRQFGTVFFTGPKHLMSADDRAGKGFENMYLFKDGQLSASVAARLDEQGLCTQLTPSAQRELLIELAQLHRVGGFPQFPGHDWWHWHVDNQTVSIVLNADANPWGGNLPTRSLEEFFKGN